MISTGWDNVAFSILFPLSSSIDLTLPCASPATNISPILSSPSWISISATAPILGSSLDSTTTAFALFLGFAFNSSSSAVISIVSSNSSRFIFCFAEISTNSVFPPQSGDISPYSVNSVLTFIGSAPGLSILFIATIIGTPASLACDIASTVWGFTPSSAATISIEISVIFAPLALISVKASCPGVSINVTFCPFQFTW